MFSALKIKKGNKGFQNASSFLVELTQKGFEKKGFSQSKLITNWNEIVGREFSKHSKPLKISFPKSGLGATLIIEIDSAFGPEIELQRETIKQKINRVYGYTAIAKIIFRPSPSLGYDAKMKYEAFEGKKIELAESRIISRVSKWSISNLENTSNQELRKSLDKLSDNFFKKPSI